MFSHYKFIYNISGATDRVQSTSPETTPSFCPLCCTAARQENCWKRKKAESRLLKTYNCKTSAAGFVFSAQSRLIPEWLSRRKNLTQHNEIPITFFYALTAAIPITNSPFQSRFIALSSAAVPRITSSWSLVASRMIAQGQSGARAAMTSSVLATR